MRKAVVIVGPTGVGKTNLALKLANELNGELINADSVQVFKSLDIISGKDKEEFGSTRVHLIDICSPTEPFSVAQFEKLADEKIREIDSKSRLPIVVGGTGLYVKSIVDGIASSRVTPDEKLRLELEKLNLEELQSKLGNLNNEVWSQMNESDRKNRRRIIRKIEILKSGIKNQELRIRNENKLQFLQIGLELSRDELRKLIEKRVEKRIRNGAIEEAKGLFENYDKLTQQVKDANGYKQLFEHFLGKTTFDEAIEKWKISEFRHAKNQMTWFKKDKRVNWFDVSDKDLFERVIFQVNPFLSS